MSYLRRLLASVLLAMVVVLVGTLVFTVTAARGYLGEQLDIQAQNVVATLALVLSQEANQDPVTRELLLTAVFDTSVLSHVSFTDMEGTLQFERQQSDHTLPLELLQESRSPAWFNRLLPFADAVAMREVSDGWKPIGTLQLSVYAGQARATLWRNALEICLLVIAAAAFLTLFLVWLSARARRMLEKLVMQPVENLAKDADWNPDEANDTSDDAAFRELRPVAQAVRDMRVRVGTAVQQQTRQIESLQLELNTDPVTGMANRRYFMHALHVQLQADAPDPTAGAADPLGHVLILRQRDLAAINQQLTWQETDEWLREVATRLQTYVAGQVSEQAVLARLNGSDVALLMPGVSLLDANRHAQEVLKLLSGVRISLGQGKWCRWALGLTDYMAGDEVSSVLKYLDQALMQAEHAGHGEISFLSLHDAAHRTATEGQSSWRHRIEKGLQQQDFLLECQQWVGVQGQALPWQRYEATLCMRDAESGEVLSAYLLMPVASRVGLSGQCDAQALRLALAWLAAHPDNELAVRFSLVSLVEDGFEAQVADILGQHAQAARRLIIELDGFSLSAQAHREHGGDVMGFCTRLYADHGVRFGLRSITQQIEVLYRLGELACAYIKLGEDFIDMLETSTGARELLRAVVRTARDRQADIVSMRSAGQAEREWLHEEGVVSLQLRGSQPAA